MSIATVNGELAASVVVTDVRRGRWTASVSVPGGVVPPDGVARIQVAGSTERVGRFVEGAAEVALDTLVASVRGGTGDVAALATPRHYRFTTVRAVLADLVADAGETLSANIDPALLATTLQSHTVSAAPVSTCLTALLARVSSSAVWRFEAGGALWCGVDSFLAYTGQADLILRSPLEMAIRVWSIEDLPLPGQSFEERHIGTVEHRVDDDGIISTVYFEQLEAGDDIKGALQRFIRASTPLDFALVYSGEVKAQAEDGTFDVQMADPRLSSHSRVRAAWAYPGVVAKVAAGTRCDIVFENGDPGRPVLTGFDATGLVELRLGAETAVGQEVVDALLKGTAYRAREKTLHSALATKLTELSVQLAAAATALGPTPGAPGAAGLTGASVAAAGAASELTSFEADAVAAGDWLSAKLRMK